MDKSTHPNDEKPYSEEEVAQARKMLAAEYDKKGWDVSANRMRSGKWDDWEFPGYNLALSAICAALRTASQPDESNSEAYLWGGTDEQLHEEALRVARNQRHDGRYLAATLLELFVSRERSTPASASEAVAWQEFSNGRWTEITKDRLDHLVHLKLKYPHLEVPDVRALYLHPALPQPAMTEGDEAIAAGDMTLHGAIDHWQERALEAEKKLAGGASASEANAEYTRGRIDGWEAHEQKCATLHQPPSGEWVMVPFEPTEAMHTAHKMYVDTSDWWQAVIAAAPPADG